MEIEPFFGTSSGPTNDKPIIAELVNAAGGLVYGVIDMDLKSGVFELVDPHTGVAFLLKDAANVCATLGYRQR